MPEISTPLVFSSIHHLIVPGLYLGGAAVPPAWAFAFDWRRALVDGGVVLHLGELQDALVGEVP